MSIEVPASSHGTTFTKRTKVPKRKLKDVSQISLVTEDVQSPTKKAKHSNTTPGPAKATHSVDTSISSKSTPFSVRTCSLYLPIAPISLPNPVPGLCAEHLSPLILTYYPPLRGVVLSYSNPRLSEEASGPPGNETQGGQTFALSIAEYGACFIWLTADFLVLSPAAGTSIDGWVNVQSESHLGLVCWNLFNATISAKRLPHDWKWSGPTKIDQNTLIESQNRKQVSGGDTEAGDGAEHPDVDKQGHWIDGQGQRIEGRLEFHTVMMDAEGGNGQNGSFVSISGSMLSTADEVALTTQEREDRAKRYALKLGPPRKSYSKVMSGASQNLLGIESTRHVKGKSTSRPKQKKG